MWTAKTHQTVHGQAHLSLCGVHRSFCWFYLGGGGRLFLYVFQFNASGPGFDLHVWHILSWRLGHEKIFPAILPLPLIQEEQLPVTGKSMCTKYW